MEINCRSVDIIKLSAFSQKLIKNNLVLTFKCVKLAGAKHILIHHILKKAKRC